MTTAPQPEIAATAMDAHRETAWALALTLGDFGAAEIAQGTGTSLERAEQIIAGWLTEGRVTLTQMRIGNVRQTVTAVRDFAPAAQPRLRTAQDNMWFTIRRLRLVTPTDLAAHATTDTVQVSVEEAAAYCRALLAAGYLRVSRKAAPKSGREAMYNLAKDTGPKPPREKRVRAVVDPNTGATHLIGGAA